MLLSVSPPTNRVLNLKCCSRGDRPVDVSLDYDYKEPFKEICPTVELHPGLRLCNVVLECV